ncbi:MAG: hypothetical protein ACJ8AT_15680 [Hyalangium sp.]|uniref:hypothetical protein n=1 Tax=Hyalangium sp. TaxID=2028555 RepID=UPI00389A801F
MPSENNVKIIFNKDKNEYFFTSVVTGAVVSNLTMKVHEELSVASDVDHDVAVWFLTTGSSLPKLVAGKNSRFSDNDNWAGRVSAPDGWEIIVVYRKDAGKYNPRVVKYAPDGTDPNFNRTDFEYKYEIRFAKVTDQSPYRGDKGGGGEGSAGTLTVSR